MISLKKNVTLVVDTSKKNIVEMFDKNDTEFSKDFQDCLNKAEGRKWTNLNIEIDGKIYATNILVVCE